MEQLLFHWGLEGGGAEVYRITVNGKERYIVRSSVMDAEDIDIWHQSETEYCSFESLWQEATKNDCWYLWHPVFINADCKPIIKKSIDIIDITQLPESEKQTIEEWKEML